MRTVAIVLAAGQGRRANTPRPKQFMELPEGPVLTLAIRRFLRHPEVDAVQVAVRAQDDEAYGQATRPFDDRLLPSTTGGATRQESARNALRALRQVDPQYVLIHDAARPMVRPKLISRVLTELQRSQAVFPTLPVTDCLWQSTADDAIGRPVDRSQYHRAQTPQGFHYADILAAHEKHAGENFDDDASLAQHAGLSTATVPGAPDNIKITTADDLRQLAQRQAVTRVGQGVDVHALGPGQGVKLCGVQLPHDRSLIGHSDADVAWHALTDAIYGALGAGDIGQHFPPSEDRWRDCDSRVFLDDAVARASSAGCRIVNVDLTIVCEHPKIAPHRDEMCARTAEACQIDVGAVGIKATTTEGLGFAGRGEGIVAFATVTLSTHLESIP